MGVPQQDRAAERIRDLEKGGWVVEIRERSEGTLVRILQSSGRLVGSGFSPYGLVYALGVALHDAGLGGVEA